MVTDDAKPMPRPEAGRGGLHAPPAAHLTMAKATFVSILSPTIISDVRRGQALVYHSFILGVILLLPSGAW